MQPHHIYFPTLSIIYCVVRGLDYPSYTTLHYYYLFQIVEETILLLSKDA